MHSDTLLRTPAVEAPAVELARSAPASGRFAPVFAVVLGAAVTLAVQGYQFGQSNHHYLLGAIHKAWPNVLANDWFTTQTLHYHAVFQAVSAMLFRLGVIQPAFLVGYLALVVLMQVTWWRLVRLLGGSLGTFVLSQVFLHVSAGGTALGLHEFFEDSAFLPSNIANVAMFAGLYFWIAGGRKRAGACFGVAGLIHLNYAAMAIAMWSALSAWELWRPTDDERERPRRFDRSFWIGTAAALLPSLANLAMVVPATLSGAHRMPLAEFVDFYVHLRHPHHYDPLAWPVTVWLSFLWPIPLALAWWWRTRREDRSPARRRAVRVYVLICAALATTLIGAGVWFISRPLVQLDLMRYSIYVQAFSCIGAALLVRERRLLGARALYVLGGALGAGLVAFMLVRYGLDWPHRSTWAVLLMLACVLLAVSLVRWHGRYVLGSVVIVAVLAATWHTGLGFRRQADPPEYLAACDWIRAHTPADAVFLVPPHEQSLRLRAFRAIVVNYKSVPHVEREFIEWRDRMEAVLDLPDLRALPRPLPRTLRAMRDRYAALPPEHLERVARRYGARYVLVEHRLPPAWEPRRVDLNANPEWFLYDLNK